MQSKPCTTEGLRRNGEIWFYMARFFGNYKVAWLPGVTGKQPATGPNDGLRPLYEGHDLPCGFTIFLQCSDSITRGGRPSDPDYLLSEQDFLSWAPNHFDSYMPRHVIGRSKRVLCPGAHRNMAHKREKHDKKSKRRMALSIFKN